MDTMKLSGLYYTGTDELGENVVPSALKPLMVLYLGAQNL